MVSSKCAPQLYSANLFLRVRHFSQGHNKQVTERKLNLLQCKVIFEYLSNYTRVRVRLILRDWSNITSSVNL